MTRKKTHLRKYIRRSTKTRPSNILPELSDGNDESTETISVSDGYEEFSLEILPDDGDNDDESRNVIPKILDTTSTVSGTEHTQTVAKLISLVPSVANELSNHDGLDVTLVSFFELVDKKEFPMNNTAFLLWMDVVKWFSCSSTTEMRYTDKTKLFWKLGWRIFGKRFVNFMGGFKSHGETVLKMSDPGLYNPGSSEINFAVPDIKVLSGYDPYDVGIECKPGIYNSKIRAMSSSLASKSACITFDGKKLKQGLTNDTGDVDLLGFEKGSTLQERRQRLEKDMEVVDRKYRHQ